MRARFSRAEMARRWTLARHLMRAVDLQALIVFGHSGVNRHSQANIFWLTNHLDLHHNYLVASLDESVESAHYVGLANHVHDAREISEVSIVAWGGYHPAQTVARRLQEVGISTGRVGLVGVNHTFGVGMPYQHYADLRQMCPQAEFVNVTADFAALRAVKSGEEITWLRRAAAFTDAAVEALRAGLRPGMPEYALEGLIEGAYRSAGGDPHLAFVRSMPMDDPNGCVPAQNPSDRIIARGDAIITEISASFWGYAGQIHRPMFVGADPTPSWQRMFDVAHEAYRHLAQAIRPGASERDAIRAASVIGEHGYAIYDDLLHGYGVDIHPPIVDRSCAQYWPWDEARPAPEGRRFERNMAIVIQPNPITPDERMGLQLGALTVVTDEGAVSLQQVPFEPIVVRI